MGNFKVGCSPLTANIYAGQVIKDGTWKNIKHDVTDSAIIAVAHRLVILDEMLEFGYRGRTYQLKVIETEKQNV